MRPVASFASYAARPPGIRPHHASVPPTSIVCSAGDPQLFLIPYVRMGTVPQPSPGRDLGASGHREALRPSGHQDLRARLATRPWGALEARASGAGHQFRQCETYFLAAKAVHPTAALYRASLTWKRLPPLGHRLTTWRSAEAVST